MEAEKKVGVIGASSFVGEQLIPRLLDKGYNVQLFSRKGGEKTTTLGRYSAEQGEIETWVCLAPIWGLVEHLPVIEAYSCKRLIALSSTSRFTKVHSPAQYDRDVATKLIQGEEEVVRWAESRNCSLTIFQPTMIYGHGRDENITSIARMIKKIKFFPLFGKGEGLRQPVHVDDVVNGCILALQFDKLPEISYILSGKEVLSYHEMVTRIFKVYGLTPRFIHCPIWLVQIAVWLAGFIPSLKGLTAQVAVRMNKDQNFENDAAIRDINFDPRPFDLSKGDVEK